MSFPAIHRYLLQRAWYKADSLEADVNSEKSLPYRVSCLEPEIWAEHHDLYTTVVVGIDLEAVFCPCCVMQCMQKSSLRGMPLRLSSYCITNRRPALGFDH